MVHLSYSFLCSCLRIIYVTGSIIGKFRSRLDFTSLDRRALSKMFLQLNETKSHSSLIVTDLFSTMCSTLFLTDSLWWLDGCISDMP